LDEFCLTYLMSTTLLLLRVVMPCFGFSIIRYDLSVEVNNIHIFIINN